MLRTLPMTISRLRLLARLGAIAVFVLIAAATLRPATAAALDDGVTVNTTIPTGSYIVNLGGGASPTVANSLKPYGFVYDVVVNDKAPVLWVTNPAKARDAKDFTYAGTDYRGSAFVITAPYVTPAVVAKIATAKAAGMLIDGPTTSPVANAPVYDTITSFPKAVVDATASSTTSIITGYFNNAGIPATQYRIGLPSTLNGCDDVLFIPHADPTWATHGILKNWVTNQKGYVWAECHAAGVLDSVDDPATAAPRDLNFLSANGTIFFKSHSHPVPPFSYANPGDPAMQFVGKLDAAVLNGSEEVYLPINNWRPTTAVGVWDPDYVNSLGGGQPVGKAAILAYGRGFGDPNAGRVMYEGGHNLATGTTADNVAAQRGVLNFLLLGGIDRRPEITTNIPDSIAPGESVPLSASVTGSSGPYTFTWSSSCGGTFAPSATAQNTTFTAPAAGGTCVLRVAITDSCPTPRRNFEAVPVTIAAVPVATADTRTTGQDITVTLNPLSNDVSGGAPLDPTSVRLLAPSTGLPTAFPIIVPGEGTYSTDLFSGLVTFDPLPGFVGIATPVSYVVTDVAGATAQSTITLTVTAGPVPLDDVTTTFQDVNVTVNPLANDTPGGAALDATSVRLRDPADGAFKASVTIFGEGTYTADPVTGTVVFDPLPAFLGAAAPLTYRVRDTNGGTGTATITVTVNPRPVASDDSAVTPFEQPVVVAVVANDAPGAASAPLDPTTVLLRDPVGGLFTPSVTVTGEGVFTVDALTGAVTFTPALGYSGTTTPLDYRVSDSNGSLATAKLTVTVTPPPGANPDAAATNADISVDVDPLANDAAGNAPIDPTTVQLRDPADSVYKTSVSIAGEGNYTVNPGSGVVTFDPAPAFRGTTTPLVYRVADTDAVYGSSTITIVVDPLVPTALPDSAITPHATTVTLDVLANDATDPADTKNQIDPTTVVLKNPSDGKFKTSVTIVGEGTYTVNPVTGAVTFVPLASFTGTTTALAYRVDVGKKTISSTLSVTVTPPPLANPDLGITTQNVNVIIDPLANDVVGGSQLDPTTVMLRDPADGVFKTTFTVPGEGEYTVAPTTGTVTFDPLLVMTGTTTPLTYRVADADAITMTSTITITVAPIVPHAAGDSGSTPQGLAKVLDVLANDTPGAVSAPLDPTAVTLRIPTTATYAPSVTVPGEGVYDADPVTGQVTFVPVPAFTGTATPVTYRVIDENGTPATAAITITVIAAPIAQPDADTTPQNVDVSVDPLANDTPGGGSLDPTTVVVRDPADGLFKTTVTIPTDGVYSVDGVTGMITFNPLPLFTGAATPVTYRVTDANGITTSSTLTITVAVVTPIAIDDAATTPFDTTAKLDVVANDTPGAPGVPLDPTTVQLVDPANATFVTAVTTVDGSYTVNAATGVVAFTPTSGFVGTTSPLTYQARDANGTPTSAGITITVTPDPIANPDAVTTPQNIPVDLDTLTNDIVGGLPFDPSTVLIKDPADGTFKDSVAISGEGTYSVDNGSGAITLTPVATFTGARTLAYEVTDGDRLTRASTATFTVTPITPSASNDAAATPFGTAIVVNVPGNDAAGAASAPLDPTSVRLLDPADTISKSAVTVAGEGDYSVDPVTGAVTFTPTTGYSGTTAPLGYRIADTNGTLATATLTVTVTPPPAASPDTDTTGQNVSDTVEPLANDTVGGAPLDPTTVVLRDPADSTFKAAVTIASEGTYTADPVTGAVTFDPLPAFTGKATPVTYRVTDGDRLTVTSTITITVTPIVPTAAKDSSVTPFERPVVIDVPGNDTKGAASAPLDLTSVQLLDPADNGYKAAVTVAAEGAYSVDSVAGTVTFSPAPGYSGTTTALGYRIADTNGTFATSTVTVRVTPPPAAAQDADVTGQNVNVTVMPLDNDTAGGAGLDPTTVVLQDLVDGEMKTTVTIADEGTYTVDPVTGAVTFDPLPVFTGAATPLTYRVTDGDGLSATATIAITVAPVVPLANPNAAATPFGIAVTIDPLDNDAAGANSAPLDSTTVLLRDPADGTFTATVSLGGRGSFSVDSTTGVITFTPVTGYAGTTPAVVYRVADGNGTVVTSTVTVTVTPPPHALDDTATTLQNVPVVISPLANDVIGGSSFDPASVRLLSRSIPVGTLDVPGEGVWSVDTTTGKVTFTPLPVFTGTTTPIMYRVSDADRLDASATITVAIVPVVPQALDDLATSVDHAEVVIDPLANDVGNPSAPIEANSLELVDPADGQPRRQVTVVGQGSWAVTGRSITFSPSGDFKGTATARYRMSDTNGTSATANEYVSVQGDPRLTVGIRANRRAVFPGKRVVYTVRVTNHGDATARNATACYVPPSGFAFTGPRQFGAGRAQHGQYCWTIERLAPGQSVRFRVAGAFVNGAPRTTLGTARLRLTGAPAVSAVAPVRVLSRLGAVRLPRVTG